MPPAVRAYHLNQCLTERYPDRALVEVSDRRFSLPRFARDGECILNPRAQPHCRYVTRWLGPDEDGMETWACQAWFEVEWQGLELDVLVVHASGEGRGVWHYFILAETREQAERFMAAVCAWNSEVRDELLVFDGSDWEKDEKLFAAIKGASLDNLVLHGTMKDDIREDVATFFAAQATYERYGVPWKRGILFVGPPGNGKTHTIKALVNEIARPCLYVKRFRGCGPDEEAIHDVFDRARKSAPCILVLEDLDSLVTKWNRSYFLNELDGFAANTGIFTIATSNHPEKLDPAIADRPSRFDRKYRFDLPGHDERRAYIARWNASLDAELQIEECAVDGVAERTANFSFAYLKELLVSALMRWVANTVPGSLEPILDAQVDALRDQMRPARNKTSKRSER